MLKKLILSSSQESEQPSRERLNMRLRNQNFNHVTAHTLTLNRFITHTLTGLGMDQIWGFTFCYDSLSVVDRTKDNIRTRQRSASINQGHQPSVNDVQLESFHISHPGVLCVWHVQQLQMTNVPRSSTAVFTHPQSHFLHTWEWQNHAAVLPNSCRRRWLQPSGSLVALQSRLRPSSSLERRMRLLPLE